MNYNCNVSQYSVTVSVVLTSDSIELIISVQESIKFMIKIKCVSIRREKESVITLINAVASLVTRRFCSQIINSGFIQGYCFYSVLFFFSSQKNK